MLTLSGTAWLGCLKRQWEPEIMYISESCPCPALHGLAVTCDSGNQRPCILQKVDPCQLLCTAWLLQAAVRTKEHVYFRKMTPIRICTAWLSQAAVRTKDHVFFR